MVKSVENIICVNKDLFNRILLITGSTSDLCLDDNEDSYLIGKSVYDKVVNNFKKLLKEKEHESFKSIKGASLERYNELTDEYESIKYNYIRNDFNKIKNDKINEEKILEISVKIYEEIENIKKIPSYINEIRKELKEIKEEKISENINSYMIRFRKLINDGGLVEDYINLKSELDSVLKKTYTDEINAFYGDSKSLYIVKNEGQVRLLDTSYLNGFTYGVIYSANSIKRITNKNSDTFVGFNRCDFNSCNIELNDDKPIAIYCVTYGERSINPNYVAAKNIYVQKNTPFIEFDKTLYMSDGEYSINELINNLLIDCNLGVVVDNNKPQAYYNLYLPFFEKFKELKFGSYDESKVINKFDKYRHFIHDQKYLDINNLLSSGLEKEDIKDILSINIYLDFNIFREGKTNKTKIKQFENYFYDKRNNEILNGIYPGLDVILNEIHEASHTRLEEIIKKVSDSPCHDSWLIRNLIKPEHELKKEELKETTSNVITFVSSGNEETKHIEFADFLKSADKDVVRTRT